MFKGKCFRYQVQLDSFSYIASIAQNHAIYLDSYLGPDFLIETFPPFFLRVLAFFSLIDGTSICLFPYYLRLSSLIILFAGINFVLTSFKTAAQLLFWNFFLLHILACSIISCIALFLSFDGKQSSNFMREGTVVKYCASLQNFDGVTSLSSKVKFLGTMRPSWSLFLCRYFISLWNCWYCLAFPC